MYTNTRERRLTVGFRERIYAAFNAFSGKVPSGKAEETPFFYSYSGAGTGQASYNIKVNPQKLRAFSETAVVRHAIDYIRNQVSKLDWDIVPIDGKKFTGAQMKQVQIAKNVFRQPNGDDNFMTFLGQLIEDMLVIGSGTFEIKKWNGNVENPYLLYPVDASSIQIYLDWDGSPTTKRYAQLDLQGRQVDFTPQEFVMVRYTPRTNTPFGIGPVESAYQQIQYLIDAQAYAGKTASSATPKKLLFLGQEITDPQLKEFRLYWQNDVEGRSNTPIIGGTDDVKSIELGASNDSSLYLQWQAFLITVIANAFGLDAMKFGATMSMGRSTGETLDSMSDEGAVKPVAHSLEHNMTQLLALFGLEGVAEFKFMFITSMDDKKAMGAVHQLYGQLDAMTINEIRHEIGLPDLPIDPETGKSMGDMTISAYRAKYGSKPPTSDSGDGSVDPEEAKGQVNGDKSKTGNEEKNNGVNGAKNIKEKSALSKAHDTGLNK
jgi:HK97 family phage portal protein